MNLHPKYIPPDATRTVKIMARLTLMNHFLSVHPALVFLILKPNSSDNFTILFHEFFSKICLSLSSWKRKQTFYWFKTRWFFSQFASWKRNHNKYLLKKFQEIRRFRIRDWWKYLMNHTLNWNLYRTMKTILKILLRLFHINTEMENK